MPPSSFNWMQTSSLHCSGVELLCTGKQLPDFLPCNEGSGFCKQLFAALGAFLRPRGAEQIMMVATITWTALQTVEQLVCRWHFRHWPCNQINAACKVRPPQSCCRNCWSKGCPLGAPHAPLMCVWLPHGSEQPVTPVKENHAKWFAYS